MSDAALVGGATWAGLARLDFVTPTVTLGTGLGVVLVAEWTFCLDCRRDSLMKSRSSPSCVLSNVKKRGEDLARWGETETFLWPGMSSRGVRVWNVISTGGMVGCD